MLKPALAWRAGVVRADSPGGLRCRSVKRQPGLLAAAAGLAALSASVHPADAKRPPAGFWESAPLTQRGESASFLVRSTRRRAGVTAVSTPAPDCGDAFGIFGEPGRRLPRLRVDAMGRFGARSDGPTDEEAATRTPFGNRLFGRTYDGGTGPPGTPPVKGALNCGSVRIGMGWRERDQRNIFRLSTGGQRSTLPRGHYDFRR